MNHALVMCHIQASGTVSHPEDFVTKPPLSTIFLHYGDTPACLVVNPRTDLQFHYTLTRPYHPSRPPYQSAPATPGTPASPCSCCSPRPSRGSHYRRRPSFCPFKDRQHQSSLLLHSPQSRVVPSYLLSRLLAVGRLHIQLVLFAGGVCRVGVLAFGLAAGVS
jgi:hypothetical protein